MLLAELNVTSEVTSGALGIIIGVAGLIVTVLGAAFGLAWWFTKQFTAAQVTFSRLHEEGKGFRTELTAFKTSQDLKFDAINLELKKQTEILMDQRVMQERFSHMGERQDRFDQQLQRLENSFSTFRVGSIVSAQAQRG